MIFRETGLEGSYIVKLERIEDKRGFFARNWCKREAEKYGLNGNMVQANISYSRNKGTLRGLHYQISPFQEAKLFRCVVGGILDIVVDLRPDSTKYCQWIGVELTQDNDCMLYVPEGCANGFQTLANHSIVNYFSSQFYTPEAERGVRYNDPAFGIKWPETERLIISDKDKSWPDYFSSFSSDA